MIFSTTFLIKELDLHWADILWGYKHGLIGWRVPVEIASLRFAEIPMYDPILFELANIDKDHDWRVGEIIDLLADRDPVPESISKRKWLFLTLSWLYENKNEVENLFDRLNEVYADFDYPYEIAAFIPMMPPDDGYKPIEHTAEENKIRILKKWREYLDNTKPTL